MIKRILVLFIFSLICVGALVAQNTTEKERFAKTYVAFYDNFKANIQSERVIPLNSFLYIDHSYFADLHPTYLGYDVFLVGEKGVSHDEVVYLLGINDEMELIRFSGFGINSDSSKIGLRDEMVIDSLDLYEAGKDSVDSFISYTAWLYGASGNRFKELKLIENSYEIFNNSLEGQCTTQEKIVDVYNLDKKIVLIREWKYSVPDNGRLIFQEIDKYIEELPD